MNLFCFSLEGSMDSLYEAVESSSNRPPQPIPSRSSSRSCSRSCSPAVLLDNNTKWRGSGRSISMEMPQTSSSNKKIRRTHVYKSASDNEILDNPDRNAAVWHGAKSREDLVHIANNHNEETMRKTKHRTETKGGRGVHHAATKKKEKSQSCQSVHVTVAASESKPSVKRSHKTGKKTTGKNGKETTKKSLKSTVHSPPTSTSPPLGAHYLDVPYRSDRLPYLGKSSTLPTQENAGPGRCGPPAALPGGATPTHTYNQRWSNPGDGSPSWGAVQHTCRRPLTEYRTYSHDFTADNGKEWEGRQEMAQDQSLKRGSEPLIPPMVQRSVTDLDLSEPDRSTSFGRFEGLRHHSPQARPEENGTNAVTEESEGSDPNKTAGLGKKMKAISLTMRRKMGKKHAKSFSEEPGDDTDKEAETDGAAAKKNLAESTNSLESLYSAQSTSSGVTSESNGSAHKDSVRLEEDGSYQGHFCGRARVHTDFVPSPYDTDSLKLKVGDIINIISKPPMGIWTGMLNNKVGNFKFIYVDVLAEKAEEEEGGEEDVPQIRQQKICKRPRPKTLLELLERLHLEEYASALLLNGYQTVEDLLHLQDKHLIELNVKDPEHRRKLLAAAECRYTGDDVREAEEHKSSSNSQQEEDSDCPRDSGCFIPSECSDSKEEAEQLTEAGDS